MQHLTDEGRCPICNADRLDNEPHLDWCTYEGEELPEDDE